MLASVHCCLCRQWSAEERQVWEERDRQEQAELAGHANASVTAEEEALPGDVCLLCHAVSHSLYLL